MRGFKIPIIFLIAIGITYPLSAIGKYEERSVEVIDNHKCAVPIISKKPCMTFLNELAIKIEKILSSEDNKPPAGYHRVGEGIFIFWGDVIQSELRENVVELLRRNLDSTKYNVYPAHIKDSDGDVSLGVMVKSYELLKIESVK